MILFLLGDLKFKATLIKDVVVLTMKIVELLMMMLGVLDLCRPRTVFTCNGMVLEKLKSLSLRMFI